MAPLVMMGFFVMVLKRAVVGSVLTTQETLAHSPYSYVMKDWIYVLHLIMIVMVFLMMETIVEYLVMIRALMA
jgi:hypothetical protein